MSAAASAAAVRQAGPARRPGPARRGVAGDELWFDSVKVALCLVFTSSSVSVHS